MQKSGVVMLITMICAGGGFERLEKTLIIPLILIQMAQSVMEGVMSMLTMSAYDQLSGLVLNLN